MPSRPWPCRPRPRPRRRRLCRGSPRRSYPPEPRIGERRLVALGGARAVGGRRPRHRRPPRDGLPAVCHRRSDRRDPARRRHRHARRIADAGPGPRTAVRLAAGAPPRDHPARRQAQPRRGRPHRCAIDDRHRRRHGGLVPRGAGGVAPGQGGRPPCGPHRRRYGGLRQHCDRRHRADHRGAGPGGGVCGRHHHLVRDDRDLPVPGHRPRAGRAAVVVRVVGGRRGQ